MNRTWQNHLLFACFLILSGTTASAYDFSYDGIYYNYKDDGMEVAGAESSIQDVIIPSQVEYEGKIWMVTSIGESAFNGCSGLTSMTIPNSVTSIGNYAFDGCSGIKELRIEDGTETLSLRDRDGLLYFHEKGLFYDCPLEKVYLGRNLAYAMLPNSNGRSPFHGQENLTDLTIGPDVTTIGEEAFSGCSGLTSLTIPSTLLSIGHFAFLGCSQINKLKIEDSTENLSVEQDPFLGCPLEKVYLGRNLSYYTSDYRKSPFYDHKNFTYLTIGHNVTTIEDFAFYGCNSLTSVSIPNSVTTIGGWAFYGCSELTSMTIPNSVTSIRNNAFHGCSQIKELKIEDGTEILSLSYNWSGYNNNNYPYKGLFYNCPLEKVYLGRNLSYDTSSSGGYSPFFGQKNLTDLTIGPEVTSLEENVFYGCIGLTSVIIPNSVRSIGNSAFVACSNIKELKIEDGTENLSLGYNRDGQYYVKIYGLFHGCPLEKVYLGRNLSYDSSSYSGYSPFYGQKNLTDLTIGTDITSLEENAFRECSGLTSLTIPSTLLSIGDLAFDGCSQIKKLTIEDGTEILSVGKKLLNGCPLEKVYLGRNLSYDTSSSGGYSPFYGQKNLTDLTIGTDVTSLEENVFEGCLGLSSMTIPNSVTSIGSAAFRSCSGLTSMTIPISVALIGNRAFENCTGLTSLSIGSSVTSIGSAAFSGCAGLKRIEFHNYDISGIESCGFRSEIPIIIISDKDLTGISATNMKFFDSLTIQYNGAKYCLVKSDRDLNYTNCLLKEDEYYILPLYLCNASYSNTNVKTFYQGKEITEFLASDTGFNFTPSSFHKDNVFQCYCMDGTSELEQIINLSSSGTLFNEMGLQNIERVKALKIIGDINGTDVMTINRMTNLKYLDLTESNIVEGGTTYRDELKTKNNVVGSYFFSGINLEVLLLPYSAKRIEDRAFEDNRNLKVVSIPISVTSIGKSAFRGCRELTSVTVPNSVTSIGNNAFQGCSKIKEFKIEDGIKKLALGYNAIDEGLFHDCPLEKVYLGRNLSYDTSSSGGYSPFYGQKNLTDLTIGTNVTIIGENAFEGCLGLSSMTIPNSVTSIRSAAFRSCSGFTSMAIPISVALIGNRAFENCTGLTSLSIGSSVTSIGESAFENCTGLTSLSIPNSVTSIGSAAFRGCSGLTSMTIPNSVATIESSAFADCASLSEVQLPANIEKIASEVFANTNLASIEIPDKVTSMGDKAFYGTKLTQIIIPSGVTSVGKNAFANNPNITKVVSLNTTPPEIESTTFDSDVEAAATLHVQKGSLVHYWLDPVWKEFANMTDDFLCLEAIPEATYGDGEIDLAQYAPDGVALTYETSNDDVVRINGTKMQIVGAGTATVGALLAEDGTPMEIVGQLRSIVVNKADLTVSVEEIVIEEGSPIPDFTYTAEGLQYDDTLEDIDNLPQPIHEVNEHSPVGEYAVTFTDGSDHNYRIATNPSRITVTPLSEVKENMSDAVEEDIEVYDLNGLLVYRGPRSGTILQKGTYIVRQGKTARKITVR